MRADRSMLLLAAALQCLALPLSGEVVLDGSSSQTCADEAVLSQPNGEGARPGAAMMQVRGYSKSEPKTLALDAKDAKGRIHASAPASHPNHGSTPDPLAHCGNGVDYVQIATHKQCATGEQRLMPKHKAEALVDCYRACMEVSGCAQFAYDYDPDSDTYQDCMGCAQADWVDKQNFVGYAVCERYENTHTTTSAPAEEQVVVVATKASHCGPGADPYFFAVKDQKCPYDADHRLFTETNVVTEGLCYERCLATTGCANFAWSHSGDYKHVCMGCVDGSKFTNHSLFNYYGLCEVASASTDPAVCKLPSAEFKTCTGWGDPHYSSSFSSSHANFDHHGVGIYKLGHTINTTFEMQVFQCPFNDIAATIAGVAWKMGSDVLTVIDDVVGLNGANLSVGGGLLDQNVDFPSGMDIKGSPSAGGVIFQSSDTCVRVRVQRHAVASARAGYVLHEQLLIASGFTGQEDGLCINGRDQDVAANEDVLFTSEQITLLCHHCGLENCNVVSAGVKPRPTAPATYNPVYTAAAACDVMGFNYGNADAICRGQFEISDPFFEACMFDYCASNGDKQTVDNAVVAQWEETAATSGVGLKPFIYEPLLGIDTPLEQFASGLGKLANHPGLCASVADVDNPNATDCTPLESYQCSSAKNIFMSESKERTEVQLGFSGRIFFPTDACGEPGGVGCKQWSQYKTCGGICTMTKLSVVQGGSCIRGTWETPHAPGHHHALNHSDFDWYEVGVGVYNEEDDIEQAILLRGKQLDESFFQFRMNQTQAVYLMFFTGSYDMNGDGTVGQMLQFRNVIHGPCMSDTQIALGPKACLVDGSNAPLTEEGYFLLAECCCDLEMEIYIRRIMADEQLQECQLGTIWGMVPYYTCVHGTQSKEALRADIWRQTTKQQCDEKGFDTCNSTAFTEDDCQAFAPITENCSSVPTYGCNSVVWIESADPRRPCGRFR